MNDQSEQIPFTNPQEQPFRIFFGLMVITILAVICMVYALPSLSSYLQNKPYTSPLASSGLDR